MVNIDVYKRQVFVIEVFSFSLLIVVSAATASAVTGCFSGLSFLALLTGKRLSLKALETTQKLERDVYKRQVWESG